MVKVCHVDFTLKQKNEDGFFNVGVFNVSELSVFVHSMLVPH